MKNIASTLLLCPLACAFLLFNLLNNAHAQTPLYSWTFDGLNGTGVPAVTTGGGTLIKSGTGSFTAAGPSGATGDFAYTATSSGGIATNNLDISGLGTLNQMTVTFWINPALAYTSLPSQVARLLMLESGRTVDGDTAGLATPGFSFALNGGTGLQCTVNNGSNPITAGVFSAYSANQWVFVAVEYDGSGTPTSSTALGTAIGNSTKNMAVLLGTLSTSVGSPTMISMATSTNAAFSPGAIVTTSSMILMVGNRTTDLARGFQGSIDNIKIYNSLLTSAQLETLRQSSVPAALSVSTPAAAAGNSVPQGTTNILSATVAGGTPPYTYQWKTDGGSGGTLTNIPGATFATYTNIAAGLGNFQYKMTVTDSASTPATVTSAALTVDVYQVISGTLTSANTNTAPLPYGSDASQLVTAGTFQSAGGVNYFTDGSPGGGSGAPVGQTFTTGINSNGYSLNSVAIELAGGSNTNTTFIQAYDLFIYSMNGSTATLLADVTNLNFSFTYPAWVQWTLATPLTLTNNATYAYTFHRRGLSGGTNSWAGLSTSPGSSDLYSGGQLVTIPTAGGTATFGNTSGLDGTFDVGLTPNGSATTTSVSRTAGSNPSTYGSSLTFTATVAGTPTPTGNVIFKDGSTTLATVALSSGQAAYTTTALTVSGSPHSIIAYYQGSPTNAPSDSSASPISQTVNVAASSVSLASSSNPSGYLGSVSFTASITPSTASGSVTFFINGTRLSTNTVTSGSATSSSVSNLTRGTTSIMAIYSGDANYLPSTNTLNQIVTNHPPVAASLSVTRAPGLSVKVFWTSLTNLWSDADGDSVILAGINLTTSNSVSITTNAMLIFYPTNAPNTTDQLNYTITDSQGGTATGLINISVVSATSGSLNFNLSGTTATLNLFGIPGYAYVLQTATNLGGPWWSLQTNTAGSDGSLNFTDSNATNAQQFYRTAQP